MGSFKRSRGGVILILLALAFSTDYMGLGVKTIHDALQGDLMPWYAFPLKAITTSVTFAFGGTGGIIAPMIFAGTMAGNLFGHLLGLDPGIFAAMGFVGVLAGAANTPIAMSILAVELFGPAIAPYAARGVHCQFPHDRASWYFCDPAADPEKVRLHGGGDRERNW